MVCSRCFIPGILAFHAATAVQSATFLLRHNGSSGAPSTFGVMQHVTRVNGTTLVKESMQNADVPCHGSSCNQSLLGPPPHAVSSDGTVVSASSTKALPPTSKSETKLLLFLGCSLDLYAVKAACTAAQAPLVMIPGTDVLTAMPYYYYLAHCDTGDATLAFVFHPGAGAPPYLALYTDNGGNISTQQIINRSAMDVKQTFGRLPSAIIVDSSLWDVGTWWQKKGWPAVPYPVPQAEITQWCLVDVPLLLSQVESAYPSVPIAFRTPPPIFGDAGFGMMPSTVDAMMGCIAGRLHGEYDLIDYYALAQPPNRTLYDDEIHPGHELSLKYANAALAWMRAR